MRSEKEEREVSIKSFFVGNGLKCLTSTYRGKIINHNPDNEPAVYAVWHGWMYGFLQIPDRKNTHILVSQSNDGEVIARTSKDYLGFSTIRGSMGRGGTRALREILKTLKQGGNIAYTLDGPKGPSYEVKDGIIKIAQMSQRPIIPIGSSCAGFILQISSWDNYRLPMFFSKVRSICGEPIYIPKKIPDEEIEEYKNKIAQEMLRLEKEAERIIMQKG